MTTLDTPLTSPTSINIERDVTIERIPDHIYQQLLDEFSANYGFQNGRQMRISDYYVKISRSLADTFKEFIDEMIDLQSQQQFPGLPIPTGFSPSPSNLVEVEKTGGFTFGSFDMAVTQTTLQNIEFQAVATYPISASKLNHLLQAQLAPTGTSIFVDSSSTTWKDFIHHYSDCIANNETEGIVLTDRKMAEQKTNFEFFATQKELNIAIDLVDTEAIFEKDNALYYQHSDQHAPIKNQAHLQSGSLG